MTSRVLFRADRLLDKGASIGPVLGLDTGTAFATLALASHGRLLADASLAAGPHGAALPDAARELLDAARVNFRELAGIAVGIGPGSFTGLRIGLCYAKGLVGALRCPIVGIGSLDAMAVSALESEDAAGAAAICPILDARKGEVYTALYRIMPDGLEKLSNDLVVPLEWLVSRIPDLTVLAGDRRAADAKTLIDVQGRQATVIPEPELFPRGRFIAALGAARLAGGEADQAAALEPLYVRPPEATLKASGKNRLDDGREGLWSREKLKSSNGLQLVTRS